MMNIIADDHGIYANFYIEIFADVKRDNEDVIVLFGAEKQDVKGCFRLANLELSAYDIASVIDEYLADREIVNPSYADIMKAVIQFHLVK